MGLSGLYKFNLIFTNYVLNIISYIIINFKDMRANLTIKLTHHTGVNQ
jgi:hypothetical protein